MICQFAQKRELKSHLTNCNCDMHRLVQSRGNRLHPRYFQLGKACVTYFQKSPCTCKSIISLRHNVNGDFCHHSSFLPWHQKLTTFVSRTLLSQILWALFLFLISETIILTHHFCQSKSDILSSCDICSQCNGHHSSVTETSYS